MSRASSSGLIPSNAAGKAYLTGASVPWFESPRGDRQFDRRLLLISCVFPPDPSVGALRWQKMSRFAAERGWGIDVLMFDPAEIDAPDTSRLVDLPAGVRVFAVPRPAMPVFEFELWVWRKLRRAGRAVGLVNGAPTAKAENGAGAGGESIDTSGTSRSWLDGARLRYLSHFDRLKTERFVRSAARIARGVLKPNVHRAVISSGPPHMAHIAARDVAAAAGLPFFMDMRDPWCFPEVAPSFLDQRSWLDHAGAMERRCVESAQLVVMNTELATAAMAERYPARADRIITVRNGSDDDPLPRVNRGRQFVVAFAGTLYMGRDPRALLSAAARVVNELGLSPDDFRVAFMGSQSFGDTPLTRIAAEVGLERHFTSEPTASRLDALEFLARANMLVNLQQDVRIAIPAKIYEYVRFDAWLLVLAEQGTAIERLLRGTTADLVAPGDGNAIAGAIRRRFEEHRTGVRPAAVNSDGRFDRSHQATRFFDALEQCVVHR